MDEVQLQEALKAAFPTRLRDAIVDKIEAATIEASRQYQPEVGWNAHVYGTAVYHFHWHGLAMLADGGFGVRVTSKETSSPLDYKLQIGDWVVACHRVASDAHTPIRSSFPSSPGGPGRMARENAEQLSLDLNDARNLPLNVVIAYASNPLDGLGAVYLCIPSGATEGGRINEWVHCEKIWVAAESEPLGAADFPPPAPDPEPLLSVRDRVKENTSEELGESA